MRKFSNTYVFGYITTLVAIVAILLSLIALKLKPLQQRNRDVEKMQQILSAAGRSDVPERKKDVVALYNKISEEWIIDKSGNTTSRYAQGKFLQGRQRAFLMPSSSTQTTEDKEGGLPVFVIHDRQDVFVVPVQGKGLWGPIWGYVAVKSDGNTIVGTSFSHKSETPGLGGEINKDKFRSQFRHKTIFDEQGEFVSIRIAKGSADSDINPQHAVDALSGATITSKGVEMMLQTCLREYVPFFRHYFNENVN